MPGRHREHYKHGWNRIAKQVRDAAYADPSTRCRRCGLTLADKPGDTWDAGHPDPGDTGIAPEHSSCNRSAGSKLSHQRRRGINPDARM